MSPKFQYDNLIELGYASMTVFNGPENLVMSYACMCVCLCWEFSEMLRTSKHVYDGYAAKGDEHVDKVKKETFVLFFLSV